MKLYRAFDDQEFHWFTNKAEAIATAKEWGGKNEVELCEIATPSKSVVLAILNGDGFVIKSTVVWTSRPQDS
jgi:hypothetical protein